MSHPPKFIPRFYERKNIWVVNFPAGSLLKKKTQKYFKYEEEARKFVLDNIPDAYDIKIETERKCNFCLHILPIENFIKGGRRCKLCAVKQEGKRKEERKNKNICSSCKNIRLEKSRYCFNHWFAAKARDNLNNSNLGIDLINLYEKQNHKCVYSGVELIPAVNMSLDHIVSRYDNKDLIHDINNVQWVHKDINVMKNRFSHENFIKLCKYIANKF